MSYIYRNCAAELRCPGPDWYEFGEFCYKPFADKKMWHNARESCRALGADLVSIRSMTEQSWLESYLYMGKDFTGPGSGRWMNKTKAGE